jgi:hypothetical protein
MVFATVAIGEKTRSDLFHLLNDIRNLNQTIYVYTDLEIDLKRYHFNNVHIVKTDKEWTDFRRFDILKHVFLNTNEKYVYYVDGDSRLFDFREEKFDALKFKTLLESLDESLDFDVLYSWGLGNVINIEWHLRPPEENENKDVRNYTYGHPEIISYFKSKLFNYDEVIKKEIPLESVLIFKKSDKIINFFDELLYTGDLIEKCDGNIGRKHKAHGSGFVMASFAEHYNIKLHKSFVPANFFKANFLNEVFLWGFNMEKNFKIF